MMGHGSPWGLFSMGQFPATGVIVGHEEVEYLRGKENIFIWCNAHSFIEKHNLHGFYTGMFISEVGEAEYCGLPGTRQMEVNESNNGFASMLGNILLEETNLENIHSNIKKQYGLLVEDGNKVASYNHYRLYYR
jgi:hypothetical protein